MNPRLQRLPQWKGFPVPFFSTIRTDGVPDFKVINEPNRKRCAMERLCWCCGERLGAHVVFVGGPKSCEARLFVDGPMHRDCADDALAMCPFLNGAMDYAKHFDMTKHDPSVQLYTEYRVMLEAPEQVCVYKTRGWDIALLPGTWFFAPWPAEAITVMDRKAKESL